jgi:hypothetical protein
MLSGMFLRLRSRHNVTAFDITFRGYHSGNLDTQSLLGCGTVKSGPSYLLGLP